VLQLAKAISPYWLRWKLGIERVEIENAEPLIRLYQDLQARKVRFTIAFRHPSTDDPPCLQHLLFHVLSREARRLHQPLQRPSHAHFIYERGVLMWAGAEARWILPRLGATPILRGKLDRNGLLTVRKLLVDSPFPVAASPEGKVNGHSEIVSPLEPGVAQMGFWCAEDLQKANRSEPVFILPLGVRYTYSNPPWDAIHRLTCELEADCNLPVQAPIPNGAEAERVEWFRDRLLQLRDYLLPLMEKHYARFYHQPLAQTGTTRERLEALLSAAFGVVEETLNLKPQGSLTERRHRLEQAAWDRIYRADLDLARASTVERGLADQLAKESSLLLWHMRLLENFVEVTGEYVAAKPTVERLAETLLLIWDSVARIRGKGLAARPTLGLRVARFIVGEPLSVSERWPDYQDNRRQAVNALTQDLFTALKTLL
jgi:hypothetical protein